MSKMQQQSSHSMNATLSPPLNLVSTEQIQKYLDENKNLILAIMECHKLGKVTECAQYQEILQKNLLLLAAIADAQSPGSSTPSQLQMPTSSVAPQGNSHMQQARASTVQQQPTGKLPFQLNSTLPQDQHNQLLHFQQQLQGHFNLGGGVNYGLNMPIHPSCPNMMDLRGNQPGGLEATPNNGRGNSGLGRNGRE